MNQFLTINKDNRYIEHHTKRDAIKYHNDQLPEGSVVHCISFKKVWHDFNLEKTKDDFKDAAFVWGAKIITQNGHTWGSLPVNIAMFGYKPATKE